MRRACCEGNHVEGQQDLFLLPSRGPLNPPTVGLPITSIHARIARFC